MKKKEMKTRIEAAEIPVWCLRVCLRLYQFRSPASFFWVSFSMIPSTMYVLCTKYTLYNSYLRWMAAPYVQLQLSCTALHRYLYSNCIVQVTYSHGSKDGWPAADQQPSSIHGNPHGNPRATRIGPDRPKMLYMCFRWYSSAGNWRTTLSQHLTSIIFQMQ